MTARRALIAALGVVAAALAAWWLSPSTQGPPPPDAAPVVAAERLPPRPLRPPAPSQRVTPPAQGPFVPVVAPRPPVDPDRVYEVDVGGIASALFDRHPQLSECVVRHESDHGPLRGRPIVRATVVPDGSFEVVIENDGEQLDNLDRCLEAATRGLTFAPASVPSSVLHPIPMPGDDADEEEVEE